MNLLGGINFDKKNILWVLGLLVLCLLGWFVFSSVLYDNGRGADKVRNDIRAAQEQQSAAAERIERVESGLGDAADKTGRISEGIGSAAKSINHIEKRIDTSKTRLVESAGLIDEGQSILAGIRARGQIPD